MRNNRPSFGEIVRAYRWETATAISVSVIAIGALGVAHFKDVHRTPDQCSSDEASNPTITDPTQTLQEFQQSTTEYIEKYGFDPFIPSSPDAKLVFKPAGNSRYHYPISSIDTLAKLACQVDDNPDTVKITYVLRNGAIKVAEALVDAGAPDPLENLDNQ